MPHDELEDIEMVAKGAGLSVEEVKNTKHPAVYVSMMFCSIFLYLFKNP
ncbi:hypothetical protein LGL55_09100 [Clostridium tagluense]|nr:hypothetical protein [Clostridium tagluense]MCB2311408.1 hypothetical protein [Clostridium tagluense]MCB2316132.1 hypothetical protein [Clostridium tagluense]MCB2321065.1 hypothetical protein [Clostridium tagluense]MCB2326081.1 hypothetical protein [Clostridium tagluense]MCB2330804.1 hypothetical protein [Clostridium tagluense]